MRVVTDAQMREIDRVTIEERGVPSLTLMERAGTALADLIVQQFAPKHVSICTGKGNNAGDGFVVARLLSQRGIAVDVHLTSAPEQLGGDAALNFSALPAKVRTLREFDLSRADVVVDAVLGTGARGVVEGALAEVIEAMNASGKPTVAVDVPSGIGKENLAAGGPCVRATVTVTIGAPKLDAVLYPGAEFVGELVVADIGFPVELINAPELRTHLLDCESVKALVPARPECGHKGTFGHVLIIAGSVGMSGAAALVGHGALRSGAGLVTIASHEKCIAAMELNPLSAIKRPLTSKQKWVMDSSALKQLEPDLEKYQAVAMGPGMTREPATVKLVFEMLEAIKAPLVLDADALNAVASDVGVLKRREAPTVITPHPREMGRLIGRTADEVLKDRLEIARAFAQEHGVVTLIKGARTVIASPEGEVFINPTGNIGLAKGGSGDLLTGLIGGLLAQGCTPLGAAQLGVYWHGLAADVALQRVPAAVMLPDDVMGALGEALRQILV